MDTLNREDERSAKAALQTVQMAKSQPEAAMALFRAGYDNDDVQCILSRSLDLLEVIHRTNRVK